MSIFRREREGAKNGAGGPLDNRWTLRAHKVLEPGDYRQLGPITRRLVGLVPERFRTVPLNRTIGSFETPQAALSRLGRVEKDQNHNLLNTTGRTIILRVEPEKPF